MSADTHPRACCCQCGTRLSRADYRRCREEPLKVAGNGAVLAWGLSCPVCLGLDPKPAPICLEDYFSNRPKGHSLADEAEEKGRDTEVHN